MHHDLAGVHIHAAVPIVGDGGDELRAEVHDPAARRPDGETLGLWTSRKCMHMTALQQRLRRRLDFEDAGARQRRYRAAVEFNHDFPA